MFPMKLDRLAVPINCSIVCALLECKHVFLTDIDENCLRLAQENIDVNCNDSQSISVNKYYWGTPLDTLNCDGLDLVIGADCIYIRDSYKALVQTLKNVFDLNPAALIVLTFAERSGGK